MATHKQAQQPGPTLGVDANTVRRWEDRGMLRTVRLPGGCAQCFRLADAGQLETFSGFPAPRVDNDLTPLRARSVD